MFPVRTVQLHAAASADESRVRRVRGARADPSTQHAHCNDGQHLPADYSQV